MENASKALIISLSVVLFNNFKNSSQGAVDMTKAEINAFNSKITPYFGEAVQGSKVNWLLQHCLSVNMSAQRTGDTIKCITVKNNTGGEIVGPESNTYTRVSTGNSYYKVECSKYKDGLINEITITKNN